MVGIIVTFCHKLQHKDSPSKSPVWHWEVTASMMEPLLGVLMTLGSHMQWGFSVLFFDLCDIEEHHGHCMNNLIYEK